MENVVIPISPEELKKQAEELLQRAADAERAAREAKVKEERADYYVRAKAVHQAVCDALVMRLTVKGVPAQVKQASADAYRGGFPYLDNVGVDLLVQELTNRYNRAGEIVAVEVVVGTYGERPQTWKADKADALPFDKIVASILRRRAQKAAEANARAARNTEREMRMAVREGNKTLAATLNAAYPYYVAPSELAAGRVVVRVERNLTETQARDLFALLQSFDKEAK